MNLTREEFLQLPAAHPPPDVKVNFENPPNIRGYSFPLFLVVVFLTNGVFLAKLWVQLRIAKKMLVEDWVLTVAWVIYAGVFCTFAGLICDLPVGMHQWDMNMAKLMRHLFLYNCAWIVYGVLMILIKINILLQYIRIFVPDRRHAITGKVCYALIALNTVFYIVFVFLLIFTCVPRRKIWDTTVTGRCLDWRIVLISGNIVTFISDVIIWVIPHNIIWRLQLKRSKKWGLSALFTIGVFAIICSAVRIHFQVRLIKDSHDSTYLGAKICFWGTCQVTAGFLVACLPSMPALYNNMMKNTWAEKVGTSLWTLLRRSNNDSGSASVGKADLNTIGGGGPGKKMPKGSKMMTDVEFEELVNRTDFSMMSQMSGEHGDSSSQISQQVA